MIENNKLDELSSRQKEILSLLRKGLTNIEICKALNISLNTDKVHLTNIYKILEVSNRTEAVSNEDSTENETESKTTSRAMRSVKDVNLVFQSNIP